MGNHIPDGIPPLLAKNWQPVPDHPNSFRNKLTLQYTHKHIINVQSVLQIQSFKSRMKQTNFYICRVSFYHQYHQSIYYVYTDQIHSHLNVSKPQVWKLHKIKIMESFWQLAQKYGFMKVSRQMIGADTNGHPKIWIHPDPVASKPWSTCDSQYTMVTEILSILQNIQQRTINKQRKTTGNSLIYGSQIQYTSFQQFITSQTQLLNGEYLQKKSKINRSLSIFQNNQAVNSLANSSQLMNKKKVRNNKTYAFDTKYSTNNVKGTHDTETWKRNEQNSKSNQLQKIFNPVLCETTRVQQIGKGFKYRKIHTAKGANIYAQRRKNLSIDRPMTYSYTQAIPLRNNIINAGYNLKQIAPFHTLGSSIPQRRKTQKLKTQKIQQLNTDIKKQQADLKYKLIVKKKISAPLGQTSIINDKYNLNYENDYLAYNNILSSREATNSLSKLLSKFPKAGIANITSPTYQRQNKTFQNTFYQNKFDSSLENIQSTDKSRQKLTQIPKRQQKRYVMPNFLIKQFTQTERQPQYKYSIQKNPSTQSHQRDPYPFSYSENQLTPKQLMKASIKIISTQSIGENSQQYNQKKPKKNTVSLQKQQLNFIIEKPIQPKPKPISIEYENFKSSRNLYQGQGNAERFYTQQQLESEKDQFDIIKDKVQQKKAKFAQLKNDARKILQDDF